MTVLSVQIAGRIGKGEFMTKRVSRSPRRKGRRTRDHVPAIDETLGASEEDAELRRIAEAARKMGIRSLDQAREMLNELNRRPRRNQH